MDPADPSSPDVNLNKALCEPCQRIFAGRWEKSRFPDPATTLLKRYDFHGNLGSLRDCATKKTKKKKNKKEQGGCPLCKVAVANGSWDDLGRDTEMSFLTVPEEHCLGLQFCPGNSESEERMSFVTLERVAKSEVGHYLDPRIGTHTFSAASQSFIGAKYSACLANHRLCGVVGKGGEFRPTRLIDADARLQDSVRVVEGANTAGRGYATLSHCWGRCQNVRLTSATLESLFRGIPVSSLPATFQHAVCVARMLGIRYLWIDSLCIVQDSVPDWEAESSIMARVYGNAVVNIAATSASDSAGGLFFQRDPDLVQPFAAYSTAQPQHTGAEPGERWYVWKDDGRWGRLGDAPLNRRGWVLQERLLSPRTIHFSKAEVVWQCLEDMGCESIPDQAQDGQLAIDFALIGDYTDIKVAIARARCDGLTDERKREILYEWLRSLCQYSRCELTVDADKLVAIAGMVQQLESLTGDECLAGLWRSQLPACLLWSVDRPLSGPPVRNMTAEQRRSWRPTQWRAPSWSWASHNLPIRFRRDWPELTCRAQLVEAVVVKKPNGSVQSARLTIRCPVVSIQLNDLMLGPTEIISGQWAGSITVLENCLTITSGFHLELDGPVESIAGLRAALILQGPRFSYFTLLFPAHVAKENGPASFRRVGTLVIPDTGASPAGGELREAGWSWEQYTGQLDMI